MIKLLLEYEADTSIKIKNASNNIHWDWKSIDFTKNNGFKIYEKF